MRELNTGTQRHTKIYVLDEPGQGNACHEYSVRRAENDDVMEESFSWVRFQDGPIQEFGVNGCHNEDLLHIVLDRLLSSQAGDFMCLENERAIQSLKDALSWLNKRTENRQKRGVEGTNEV